MNKLIADYKESFFHTTPSRFFRDIMGGIIVALISIPISMGYAQVAGLPMQYGLYGSVFPILLFGLLTTSRDFVFGVDAAPAALTGAAIASMGITAQSEQAMTAVPTIAFLVACWMLVFWFLGAGRIVKYISIPVMSGFVTGICCTIILMQSPKLFGGTAGTGEIMELSGHIAGQLRFFHPLSFFLGISTIVLILLGKRFIPKLPVSVIVMVLSALLSKLFDLRSMGVSLLPHVDSGFPGFSIFFSPDCIYDLSDYLFASLSIAAVILSESLLASKGNAMKDGYELKPGREILAYAAANFAGAVTGSCPMNGSVSRTGIVRQFGAKSQWLSVSAAATMFIVLYFGTPIIEYLPVPVLTAIVISALLGACEFKEAARLWKQNRNELYIFGAAMFGVLVLGTVPGVMTGIVLSFFVVIVRAVTPPRSFMGVIPGREGFYSLGRSSDARPVKNALIYRFGGNLFCANIDTFVSDIENAITDETRVVVVNAVAVSSIDITAADRLVLLNDSLKKRGIRFYMTEHMGEVNDLLRKYGAGELLKNGSVRMTVSLALRDAGLPYPYVLDDPERVPVPQKKVFRVRSSRESTAVKKGADFTKSSKGIQAELEWALGEDAEKYKDQLADELITELAEMELREDVLEKAESSLHFGRMNLFDEDELIDRIELRLADMSEKDPEKLRRVEGFLETRRAHIEKRMYSMDPRILQRLINRRHKFAERLKEKDPKAYELYAERTRKYLEDIKKREPELAARYDEAAK